MSDRHVELVGFHFAQVPEALLYDRKVSAEAVRIYGALVRHGTEPIDCFPSHARLAELLGCSPRSIPKWTRELERAGWIERVPRFTAAGDPDSNGYRVHARQRGGSALARGEGSAPTSAPNESKKEREPINDGARKRATTAPSDFAITDRLRAWARDKVIPGDLAEHTERFLNYHRAKGSAFKDWDAAWRTWMLNELRFARERAAPPSPPAPPRKVDY